jgi:hypothetical protein
MDMPEQPTTTPTRVDRLRSGLLAATSPGPAILTRREATFSGTLTIEDRRRLRAIVQRTHKFLFAVDASTSHLDQVIDSLGPEVSRKMIFEAMAARKID